MALELCTKWSLIDIGINLTDKMYTGSYQGHVKHKADLAEVLSRARRVGVRGLLITGGNLKESKQAIEQCRAYGQQGGDGLVCYSTVGCHPTRCQDFLKDPAGYYAGLEALLEQHSVRREGGCVAAIGEIGLDYDRLFFCPREVQLEFFRRQLDLAEKFQLPLFLHDRNTGDDFYDIIRENRSRIAGGVVHSFTGSATDLQRYLDLDLYVGINGCSLKTEENLAVARAVPLDRLLIETDGPWCDMRNTHASRALLTRAGQRNGSGKSFSDVIIGQFPTCKKEKFAAGSMVKGRCEPCNIVQVLEVLYELHSDTLHSMEELADIIYANTRKLFPFPELATTA